MKEKTATLIFCIFLILGAFYVCAKVVQNTEPVTWTDAEHETNQQCAYLIDGELEKCRLNFNLDK